jgi:hypothetical protein
MPNDTAKLDPRKLRIIVGIGVVIAALICWCIGAVWSHQPQVTPKLVLILLGFGAATGGMLFVSTQTIATVKIEHPRDMESRIDTIIVGTILVVVVLCGAFVEAVGLTCFSGGGFAAACLGLMLSLASLIVGVLIGFLFGVPRSVAAPDSGLGPGGRVALGPGAENAANQLASPPLSSPPVAGSNAAGSTQRRLPSEYEFDANFGLADQDDCRSRAGRIACGSGVVWEYVGEPRQRPHAQPRERSSGRRECNGIFQRERVPLRVQSHSAVFGQTVGGSRRLTPIRRRPDRHLVRIFHGL